MFSLKGFINRGAGTLLPAGRMASAKRKVLIVCCLAACMGCASLPDASAETEKMRVHKVAFETARGPVSASKSAAILEDLKRKSGDIDILQKHIALEEAINVDSPLVLGNKLLILLDGPATYKAMSDAISKAKDHINFETYIFEDDEIGQKFAGLLLEKQAAGVQVNLIYDSVGSIGTPREFFDRLKAAGVQVVEFNPVNPLAGKTLSLNNRDHRKLLVVDGRIAFLGGINISESYSSSPSGKSGKKRQASTKEANPKAWRDTHLQIEGPVVAQFQKLFIDTWTKQKGAPLAQKAYFPKIENKGNEIVRALGSASTDPYSVIYLTLLSAIEHAEKEVQLTNAYFAPDPQLIKALTDAARRGVDVKIILPSVTDSWAVFHAGRSHYSTLLEAGVKVYERRGAVMHAKTASIDGVWSTIGSTNLDWRSFLHNDEINAAVLGRDFAQQMNGVFAKDLAESNAIQLEQWEKRSILFRIKEWAARLAEYWL